MPLTRSPYATRSQAETATESVNNTDTCPAQPPPEPINNSDIRQVQPPQKSDDSDNNVNKELNFLKQQLEEISISLAEERRERLRLSNLLSRDDDANSYYSSRTYEQQIPRFAQDRNLGNKDATLRLCRNNCMPRSVENSRENNLTDTQNIFKSREKRKLIDLPNFDGKPEEWPTFIVSFKESTSYMEYSGWENHLRLNKSLTGEAREAVSSLLIHPDNIEEVIAELERLYGKPEHLLQSQMQKVSEIQPIPENKLGLIISFATKVRNLAAFLENLGADHYLANPNLIQDLIRKLPPSKRIDWGVYAIKIKPYVTIRDFSNWITEFAEVISVINISTCDEPSTSKFLSKPKSFHYTNKVETSQSYRCIICKGFHKINECETFKSNSIKERWEIIKKQRLCFSCLKFGHQTFECRSRRMCGVNDCRKNHNPLLHENFTARVLTEVSNENEDNEIRTAMTVSNRTEDLEVYFKIIPVKLYSEQAVVETFAMIDDGAAVTLIDEDILKCLKVKGKHNSLNLQWFGNTTSTSKSQSVDLHISGIGENYKKYPISNCQSVRNINLPIQTLNICDLPCQSQVIKKLPIKQYREAKPMILIGLDNINLGVPDQVIQNCKEGPSTAKTKLGWIVYGPRERCINEKYSRVHMIISNKDDDIKRLIDDYFTTDSFGVRAEPAIESDRDIKDKEILSSTTNKIGERYQTGLLWKNTNIQLPNSYNMAKKRLLGIENKMAKDPVFKKTYTEMINNFIGKKYAKKLSIEESNEKSWNTWYLPHFAASNPNKPKKLRLVFDAAAPVNGTSLNDFISKGPDYYNPLMNVIFNFRMKTVAVCADIREMFSQILIQPCDRHAQRFLWREGDNSKPIDVYQMDRMTFGMTCSPASAHYIKNINANIFAEDHPEAVKSIIKHHYVDDYIDSFESIEKAIEISKMVTIIHKNAGFELRGFLSNCPEVANRLNNSTVNDNIKEMNLNANTTEKILGMYWDTMDDAFKFELKFNRVNPNIISGTCRPSKRELLSIVMSVFDPFGFLGNILIHLKSMLQELWIQQIEWDEPIPDDINTKWIEWKKQLEEIKNVKIYRHYFKGLNFPVEVQLHTFVDASEEAFSAVTYLRICDIKNTKVRFVCGKIKCAPVKKLLSISRLELQAAVLGTRLSSTVNESHELSISKRFFWSDSSTVINWIKSDNRKYKPFVAHRIAEILNNSNQSEWNWISTKFNVADDATRARFPIKFNPNSRWLNGPSFLEQKIEYWPKQNFVENENKLTIIIDGNIGSGKSTLLENLKNESNICVLPEPINKWKNYNGLNLLELYYKNPKQWGFKFQNYVITTMTEHHLMKTKEVKVMERSIFTVKHVFLEYLLKSETISRNQFKELSRKCDEIIKDNSINANLIIYINTNTEIAFERMKSRGRTEEDDVTYELIAEIEELYEKYLRNSKIPVCFINGNQTQEEVLNDVNIIIKDKILNQNNLEKTKHIQLTKKVINFIDFSKYSTYTKLKRVIAWMSRFINNKFNLSPKRLNSLSVDELKNAEVIICRHVQHEVFSEEFHILSNGNQVKKSSPIFKLSPMLDNNNIIKINGRIKRATAISDDAKYPIILPKNHKVTELIVDYFHNKMHHHNENAIIGVIRLQFWIPNVKAIVRKIRFNCQECKNRLCEPQPPMMGDLPYDRTAAFVRPFSYTGLDYFGPYEVAIGRSRVKRWVALFTCLTIRAVHLEIAEDLSTDSCLRCIKNFINRRGKPVRIRSDNGTNFVGAAKEISDAINTIDNNEIKTNLENDNIQWVFNCPDNPHAGGSWERLVQADKKVLSYILKDKAPRLETFRCLLCEAECIVNSRPLTEVPLSYEEEEPLTPNHFLIGTMNSCQTPILEEIPLWRLRKQWRITTELKNQFWRKWVSDYLPNLIRRSKWYNKTKPIKIGDVVLIVEPNISRNEWSKGRVIEVFSGADGQVRTVKIKTSKGELKRPAVKVIVLDVIKDG